MLAAYGPLVAELSDRVAAQFGTRLHSAYLYGSIPRGTATPGRSDLDADAAVITDLIGGLGRWLAEEYGRTMGVKAPRA